MPYGDKKSYGFFKMKYQGSNSAFPFKSPIKKDKVEFTRGKKEEEKHFLTKQSSIPQEKHATGTYFSKNIKEANKKKLKELETKFKAGNITQEAFERKRKELKTYTDY